jgi:hypothetical protein
MMRSVAVWLAALQRHGCTTALLLLLLYAMHSLM